VPYDYVALTSPPKNKERIMTILKTLHAEYLTQLAKIERMKLDAQNIGDEIQVLQSQLAEAVAAGTNIEARINNPSYDMAAGKLSAVEFMQLKQDLEANKLLITGLQELIPVQEAAQKLIIGSGYPRSGLGLEDANLNVIRSKINTELLKSAMAALPTQTLEEIKNIAQLMACGNIYDRAHGDSRGALLYEGLSIALCSATNQEAQEFDFNDPATYHHNPTFSFEQARAYRDSLIDAL